MDYERYKFKVLIVDSDDDALKHLANILMEWQCIVKTAKDVQEALVILQTDEGFYNLIITEFHLPVMNGFDFLKLIRDQYHIPLIMMSKDNNHHLISKTLENGAVYFLIKPFCAEDFENIWKNVIEAKKHKLCRKRNNTEQYLGDGEHQVVKKSRLVWTTYLHNLFLFAIKQIGSEKAKPRKIRDIMNIPNLTTENVASHLQKYHKFQRDIANKRLVGGLSDKPSRSMFALELPMSVEKEIMAMRANKHRKPKSENSVLLDFNGASASNSSYRGGESSNAKILNFGGFDLDYVSDTRVNNASEFQVASNNEGNAYENVEFQRRKLEKNVMENEQNYNVGTSINEVEFNQTNLNIFNSLMDDDHMNLFNEMNVNHDASELLKSYTFNFFQDVFPLEQLYNGFDDVSPTTEITSLRNKSPKSLSQNSIQLHNDGNNVVSPLTGITSCVRTELAKSSSENSNQLHNDGNNVVSPLTGITSCVWTESAKSSGENSNQLYNIGNNVISPLTGITSCVWNESPRSSSQNSNLLQGNERFSNGEASNRFMEDNMSKASTSAAATDLEI